MNSRTGGAPVKGVEFRCLSRAASWPESLGLYQGWLMTKLYKCCGSRFDQWRRPTHENPRILGRRPPNFDEHLPVDSASESVPDCRLLASEGVHDLERVVIFCKSHELVTVDDVVPAARRVKEPRRDLTASRCIALL